MKQASPWVECLNGHEMMILCACELATAAHSRCAAGVYRYRRTHWAQRPSSHEKPLETTTPYVHGSATHLCTYGCLFATCSVDTELWGLQACAPYPARTSVTPHGTKQPAVSNAKGHPVYAPDASHSERNPWLQLRRQLTKLKLPTVSSTL